MLSSQSTAQEIIASCMTHRGDKHLTTACTELAFQISAVQAVKEFKFDVRSVKDMINIYMRDIDQLPDCVEMFVAVHEKAQLDPVSKEMLFDLAPRIWIDLLDSHHFDTAKEVWKLYKDAINDEVDVAEFVVQTLNNNDEEILFEEHCGKVFDNLIETSSTKGPLRDVIFEVLIMYLQDREVDWNEEGIITFGQDEEGFEQNMMTWMVRNGWTPLPEQSATEEAHTRFKEQHFKMIEFGSSGSATRVQSLMSYIDENVQGKIPDGVYLGLADRLKTLHTDILQDHKDMMRLRRLNRRT